MTIPARTETIKQALPGAGSGWSLGHIGVGQSVYAESVTPTTTIGKRLKVGNRTFHYAKHEGGTSAGLMQIYAVDTDVEDTVTVAHGIGTTELTIEAATIFVKDQYAEGMLIVHKTGGTGAGDQYVIKSNAAIAANATGLVTIYEPGLLTAWSITDTDVTLWSNPYFGIAPNSAVTSAGAGIPLIDISDGYYFWLQTWGPAGVKITTATDSGADTAEAAFAVNATGDLVKQSAGYFQCAHVLELTSDVTDTDADFGYVFLTCDP